MLLKARMRLLAACLYDPARAGRDHRCPSRRQLHRPPLRRPWRCPAFPPRSRPPPCRPRAPPRGRRGAGLPPRLEPPRSAAPCSAWSTRRAPAPALGPSAAERHLARAASRHAARHGAPQLLRPRVTEREEPESHAPGPPAGAAASARSSPGAAARWPPRARSLRAWLNSPPHRAIVLGNGRVRRHRREEEPRLRRPRPLGDGSRLVVALLEVEPRRAVLLEREVERSRPLDLVDPLLRSRERPGRLASASPTARLPTAARPVSTPAPTAARPARGGARTPPSGRVRSCSGTRHPRRRS